MMRQAVRLGCSLTLLVWVCGIAQADIVFDLSDVPVGTVTPFSDTEGGVTATFSSPADPFGFEVFSPNFLATFAPPITGNVLSNDTIAAPLDITFSQSLSTISLDFATIDTAPVTLNAFVGGIGGTMVASVSATGVVPDGYVFPQGVIGLASPIFFDTIELSYDYYIVTANFDVSPAIAVPEPSTLVLCLVTAGSMASYVAVRRAFPAK